MNYKSFWDKYYKQPDERVGYWEQTGKKILEATISHPDLKQKLEQGREPWERGVGKTGVFINIGGLSFFY
jgi:hypothetical protein